MNRTPWRWWVGLAAAAFAVGCPGQVASGPGKDAGPCVPATCGSVDVGLGMGLRIQCGMISDGCGGVLDCGGCKGVGPGGALVCGCDPPFTVYALEGLCVDVACDCFEDKCCPTTCAHYFNHGVGANCGTINDGCGNVVDCGTCSAPETCGGGGTPNLCGVCGRTCAEYGYNCGDITDGCGNKLSCGTCALPDLCNYGGPHVCGH